MTFSVGKNKRTFIRLWIPTACIKMKFIAKHCLKNLKAENCEPEKLRAFLLSLYKQIRKHIKSYGHFTLLEVCSSDNYRIRIKV